MTSPANTSGAATTAILSLEALVELQRKTIDEHVRTEQIKDWEGVYRTFTRHPEKAYYDVVLDKETGHLEAERIYFDNNTILAQIQGELSPDDVFDLGRIEEGATGAANNL